MNTNKEILEKAKKWTSESFDQETRRQVQELIDNNPKELEECFYKGLEFGTGGLRGIMGVGINRMNKYTVSMATQGLANYLKKSFGENTEISVAIAHDCRNNSRLFAESTANIFSANNIKVYLFESLRPTPELSYAIRKLNCKSGVVITASHNPKEYNGYKAYWDDGGQIISPHDKNIIKEVNQITDINQVKQNANKELIQILGEDFDLDYIEQLKTISLNPELNKKHANLKIVYTPIHGTGVKLVPQALHTYGFNNIINVPEQDIVDGNFPTVSSPNPENADALELALKKARKTNADLVMATDPDSDRVGIAVKNLKNEFILLNGNQTAAILFYYMLKNWEQKHAYTGKEYIVKTIVTSDLLIKIADSFNVTNYEVLTGFKYIADIIKQKEDNEKFIVGGEESYGYLAGEFVRDKDAVMSCALIAEAAAWAKENNKSLYQILIDIYSEYGFYKETLVNIVKKGKDGAEAIQKMMNNFRISPPVQLNNSKVVLFNDFQKGITENRIEKKADIIHLPKSNVLQFICEDGSKISIRPSGTEPKIKFYVSVNEKLSSPDILEETEKQLDEKINQIKIDLGL